MSNTFIATILLLITTTACSTKKGNKYFLGTIEYAYSFTSDSLNGDSIAALRPRKSDFRYDLNDYQSRFTGKDTETYYYSGKLNKCFGKLNNQPGYSCEDYGVANDSVISWKIYDTGEKILGQTCRILEMQKKNSWVKYYVSTDLKIAPATYQGHKAYNWDVYGEKAEGGLILRSEHRFRSFTLSGIATGLKEQEKGFKALQIDETLMDSLCNNRN